MQSVIFDLDETLIDRSLAVTNFANILWQEHTTVQDIPTSAFVNRVHKLDGNGYTAREEFFATMTEGFDLDEATVKEAFYAEVWETPQLAEGVIDCLEQLKSRNVRLGIVSNGSTQAQHAKIDHSGLAPYFDSIIVSETFGVKKPDPSIYLAIASELSSKPEQSWFIGDHPINDVWGSKQVGFSTGWIHLNRPWSDKVEPCCDIEGANFQTVMTKLLGNG